MSTCEGEVAENGSAKYPLTKYIEGEENISYLYNLINKNTAKKAWRRKTPPLYGIA